MPKPAPPHSGFARYALSLPEFGAVFVAEVEWNTPRSSTRHAHAEIQLLCILRGTMSAHFSALDFELAPGGVCVIPAGLKHCVSQRGGAPHVSFLDVRFGPRSHFAEYLNVFGGQQVLTAGAAALRARADELRAIHAGTGASRNARLLSALWGMLGGLSAGSVRQADESSAAPDRRLALADGFMKDALATDLDVQRVADYAGLSRSQLTRLYKQHRHIGPAERLRELRVERARQLLTGSTLNVKEIARACGFACPNHFCRVFAQQMKRTPSQYRRAERFTAEAQRR